MSTVSKKQWRVYKPKKTNDGAASRLEMRVETKPKEGKDGKSFLVRKVLIFWVSAKQTGTDSQGNASFAWEDPTKMITIKLGEPDLGEMLAVLNGKKDATGSAVGNYAGQLYHQNEKGSTSFSIKRSDKGGYFVNTTKKVGKDAPVQINHTLSLAEAEILKLMVEAAVRQTYLW